MKNYDDPNYGDEFFSNSSLVSNCCGAPPWGEVSNDNEPVGICSRCKAHAVFEKDTKDERIY